MNNRLGEERLMNCGLKAKIIRYGNSEDIDIQFENGIISYNKTYQHFKKGEIGCKPNRIGEINMMSCGMKAEIIAYRNKDNIDIKFEDGNIVRNVRYKHFLSGLIKNPFIPIIFGRGYIGETKYINEKIYNAWHNMMRRCYDEEFHKKQPTYKDCKVCEEWHNYGNFQKWWNECYYELENEKVELDKDILIKGNKIYSPNTCVFVPSYINKLFVGRKKDNSLPRGIYYDKKINKYISQIVIRGKKYNLGRYNTIVEAERVYNNARFKAIKDIAEEYKDKIPDKLYNRLIEISNYCPKCDYGDDE